MLWIALALAEPPPGGPSAASPAADQAEAEHPRVVTSAFDTHSLTVAVKSPPAGAVVEAIAFGETRLLKDPGVGVHSTTFRAPSSRFAHLELALNQNGVRTPLYDGVVPMTDAREDVVSFVVSGGQRPSALRTTHAPSAVVRMWTDPVSVTRYGWGALLALYAAVLLISTTRRA